MGLEKRIKVAVHLHHINVDGVQCPHSGVEIYFCLKKPETWMLNTVASWVPSSKKATKRAALSGVSSDEDDWGR